LPDSLIDTNILIYAHDPRDLTKQQQAIDILAALERTGAGVLSVQCLAEFFRVATARLPEPLSPSTARAQVDRFASVFRALPITRMVVLEACRGVVEHQVSIWDALIWSAAKLNQVPLVLTEDAPHGRLLEGVRYLNPFDPTFDLAELSA
jgi:predicted nucleic acid-binding protein